MDVYGFYVYIYIYDHICIDVWIISLFWKHRFFGINYRWIVLIITGFFLFLHLDYCCYIDCCSYKWIINTLNGLWLKSNNILHGLQMDRTLDGLLWTGYTMNWLYMDSLSMDCAWIIMDYRCAMQQRVQRLLII